MILNCRSQWPRGLRRRSTAACLLRSWVRIPPGAWMFVCCECSVLSGRGICDELITRPEESHRLWFVVVCDLETSRMGSKSHKKKMIRNFRTLPNVELCWLSTPAHSETLRFEYQSWGRLNPVLLPVYVRTLSLHHDSRLHTYIPL